MVLERVVVRIHAKKKESDDLIKLASLATLHFPLPFYHNHPAIMNFSTVERLDRPSAYLLGKVSICFIS